MKSKIMTMKCHNLRCAEGDEHTHGEKCTELCSTCHGIDWNEKEG